MEEAIKVIVGKSRNAASLKDNLKRNADEALSQLFTGEVYYTGRK